MRVAARQRGVNIRGPEGLCGPERWFHGVRLDVLAPCPGVVSGTQPNDASLVLRMTFGHASALFPGDLERRGEARVFDRLQPVTLLKVGHHGSHTSSTEGFLARLAPAVALVSAGNPSPFGHPHRDVLARMAAHRIPVWSTAEHGGVAVTLRRDGTWSASEE
jgi:competence protein ComEC